MKQPLLIIIPFLLVILSALSSCGVSQPTPRAAGGVLDASAWDFNSGGTVRLDGEWEFYWGVLAEPGEFRGRSIQAPRRLINVPDTWERLSVDGRGLPGQGTATYRLLMKLPRGGVRHGLKVMDMSTAYRLWVNGVLISSNGIVGHGRDSMKPQFLPAIVFFTPENQNVEIVLQVSNFFEKNGGFWHSMHLGYAQHIINMREIALLSEASLMGILIIMAFYHFVLFVIRRQDRSSLYFSMFCLVILFRTILMGERMLIDIFPAFNWEAAVKIEHVTFYMGLAVFTLFLSQLYREEIHHRFTQAITAAGVISTAVVLSTPAEIFTHLITPYHVITGLAIIYMTYALLRALVKGRDGSVLILSGFSALCATVINDILYTRGWIDTGFMVSWGLALFIFFQSIVISIRLARSFNHAEFLAHELKLSSGIIMEYNTTLEQKVRERTKRVLDQKEFLEEQVAIAERLQRTLLPAVPPTPSGAVIGFSYKPVIGIGGDFLDFRTRGDTGLGIFICDVSGHGVAGALIASMVKMSLNNWNENLESPVKTLTSINDSLKGKLGHNFISACACYIELDTGIIKLASAGHPPLIIIREGEKLERIKPRGRVITDIFTSTFDESESRLIPGDKIILYTDGITEARNEQKEIFEERRFEDILKRSAEMTPQALCDAVISGVLAFLPDAAGLEDDITIIAAEYSGPPGNDE